MATPASSVRLPERVSDWLAEVGRVTGDTRQPGALVPPVVEQFIAIVDSELERFPLTLGEATLLGTLSGRRLTLGQAGSLLAMQLADAVQPTGSPRGSLAAQCELEFGLPAGAVSRLIERLRTVGSAADFALRLALARWREGHGDKTAAGFGAAGLRIVDASMGGVEG